jgi:signal transduction histidine kinase
MPTVVFPAGTANLELSPVVRAAAEERLRALMTLTGGLAHNLRSPLTAIMGRAELIGARQPELGEQIAAVVSQCDRINETLKALTAKLALEAETAPRPVDLRELVERECDFMALDRHFKHEVHKELALPDGLPRVTAVYGALAQAFRAIVDNAVIALRGAAEQRLAISTEVGDGAVRLTVRDTGCGIPPNNLVRVIEPGFTTRSGDCYGPDPVEGTGRGYGLTLAAVAVHGCGGTIEVSCEPGAGTSVTITLPVR